MTTYTDLELWAIISAVYYDKNEFITVEAGRTKHGLRRQIGGLQAEVLHTESIDPVEKVGHPAEVFVTPRDVFDLTVYGDLGTVRRRLDDLVAEGLLDFHGDVVSHSEGDRRLYLPAELDRKQLVESLHELDGRPVPSVLQEERLTHVVPSDFTHKDGGVFTYDKDSNIEVDVSKPDDQRSIRKYVEQQLHEEGLTADIGNFYYKLRDHAGLIE
ncbi:hypothetical protein [Halohasta litorea]|uniref:DUF2250 domain-containing protein n=1 Tax=Halohasta litorea TaxID=869891 RepID=A0ABD6DA14_9EURY|nr:hypothetical protein [Halohasta litorea]